MMDVLARGGVALLVLGLVVGAAFARAHRAPFTPRKRALPAAFAVDFGGAPLVLLHFTSRLCASCHETPALAREAAPHLPLVALPVERHAGLARELGVTETPTLLLVDARGRIRWARAGNPRPDELKRQVARATAAAAPWAPLTP